MFHVDEWFTDDLPLPEPKETSSLSSVTITMRFENIIAIINDIENICDQCTFESWIEWISCCWMRINQDGEPKEGFTSEYADALVKLGEKRKSLRVKILNHYKYWVCIICYKNQNSIPGFCKECIPKASLLVSKSCCERCKKDILIVKKPKKCMICFEKFKNNNNENENIILSNCGWISHLKCLIKWWKMNQKKHCPKCSNINILNHMYKVVFNK